MNFFYTNNTHLPKVKL